MFEVATALGLVKFPMHTSQDKVNAEIRALKLLANIVEKSGEWQVRLNSRKQVVLHTYDDNPGLMIDPCATVERYYKEGNEHLVNYMFMGSDTISPCVIIDQHAPSCAVADTVVSLVLLAEAGWPAKQTPTTLAMMRQNLRDSIRGVPDRSILTEYDIERLDAIELSIDDDDWLTTLTILGEHSRLCYTCKGWTEEEVQNHIEPILVRIPICEIRNYLASPNVASDALFIANPTLQ